MQLAEFFDYKNQLMGDLLTNKAIVELLDPDIDIEDAHKLAYTQVFPCEYIPDTVQDGKTYICFDVDISRTYDKTFYQPTLNIWIFTHRSLLRLPDGGGVRTDKICSEICEAINGSRFYGLGELILSTVKRFAPMTDYQGKYMAFNAKDFNMQFNPHRPTPSNRKEG